MAGHTVLGIKQFGNLKHKNTFFFFNYLRMIRKKSTSVNPDFNQDRRKSQLYRVVNDGYRKEKNESTFC